LEATITVDADVVARCINTIVKVVDPDVANIVDSDASAGEFVVQMFTETEPAVIFCKVNLLN